VESAQSIEKQAIAENRQAAEGNIRTAEGKSGCPAREIRSAAGDIVPTASEIGSAAWVFRTAESKIGTAEEVFRIPERVGGCAEGKIGTAEEIFGTVEESEEGGAEVKRLPPENFGFWILDF